MVKIFKVFFIESLFGHPIDLYCLLLSEIESYFLVSNQFYYNISMFLLWIYIHEKCVKIEFQIDRTFIHFFLLLNYIL